MQQFSSSRHNHQDVYLSAGMQSMEAISDGASSFVQKTPKKTELSLQGEQCTTFRRETNDCIQADTKLNNKKFLESLPTLIRPDNQGSKKQAFQPDVEITFINPLSPSRPKGVPLNTEICAIKAPSMADPLAFGDSLSCSEEQKSSFKATKVSQNHGSFLDQNAFSCSQATTQPSAEQSSPGALMPRDHSRAVEGRGDEESAKTTSPDTDAKPPLIIVA